MFGGSRPAGLDHSSESRRYIVSKNNQQYPQLCPAQGCHHATKAMVVATARKSAKRVYSLFKHENNQGMSRILEYCEYRRKRRPAPAPTQPLSTVPSPSQDGQPGSCHPA